MLRATSHSQIPADIALGCGEDAHEEHDTRTRTSDLVRLRSGLQSIIWLVEFPELPRDFLDGEVWVIDDLESAHVWERIHTSLSDDLRQNRPPQSSKHTTAMRAAYRPLCRRKRRTGVERGNRIRGEESGRGKASSILDRRIRVNRENENE